MTTIKETIPAMPEAPDSSTDTRTEFNVKSDAFVKAWTPHTASINTWSTEANTLANDINNIVASLPQGTINDTDIGTDKVFSNQKTEDTYVSKSGDTMTGNLGVPTISYNSKTLNVDELSTLGGSSQTWKDMSAGKGYNTPNINNTGRPIFVSVQIVDTGNAWTFLEVGGVRIAGSYITGTSSSMISGIVPDGATYTLKEGSQVAGILQWSELR